MGTSTCSQREASTWPVRASRRKKEMSALGKFRFNVSKIDCENSESGAGLPAVALFTHGASKNSTRAAPIGLNAPIRRSPSDALCCLHRRSRAVLRKRPQGCGLGLQYCQK